MSEIQADGDTRQAQRTLKSRRDALDGLGETLSLTIVALLSVAAFFAAYHPVPSVSAGIDVHPDLIAYARSAGALIRQDERIVGMDLGAAAAVFAVGLGVIIVACLLRGKWKRAGMAVVGALCAIAVALTFQGAEEKVSASYIDGWARARLICETYECFSESAPVSGSLYTTEASVTVTLRENARRVVFPSDQAKRWLTTQQKAALGYEAAQFYHMDRKYEEMAQALSSIPRDFRSTRVADARIFVMLRLAKMQRRPIAADAYRPANDGRNPSDLVVYGVLILLVAVLFLAQAVVIRMKSAMNARLRRIEQLSDKLAGRPPKPSLLQRLLSGLAEVFGIFRGSAAGN